MKPTLIDTNIVIYAHQGDDIVAATFIEGSAAACSVITRIEALGFAQIAASEVALLTAFFEAVPIFDLDKDVVEMAIALRRRRAIKLGDSIIAATALVDGWTVATRNARDFRGIDGLDLVDPYAAA